MQNVRIRSNAKIPAWAADAKSRCQKCPGRKARARRNPALRILAKALFDMPKSIANHQRFLRTCPERVAGG